MQIVGQVDAVQNLPPRRQQRQVGAHLGQVQFGPVGGVGLYAAIGNDQAAIRQSLQIMRTDALTVPFRNAGKARSLPDPDAPG